MLTAAHVRCEEFHLPLRYGRSGPRRQPLLLTPTRIVTPGVLFLTATRIVTPGVWLLCRVWHRLRSTSPPPTLPSMWPCCRTAKACYTRMDLGAYPRNAEYHECVFP